MYDLCQRLGLANLGANCDGGSSKMISVLRTIARDEVLLGTLDRLVEREALADQTHGVALSIDGFWLSWIRSDFDWREFRYSRNSYGESLTLNRLRWFYPEPAERLFMDRLKDHDWRPPAWSRHCALQNFQVTDIPVLIKIIIRDQTLNLKEFDLPSSIESSFGNHPLRYEFRPSCVALSTLSAPALSPSASIGQASPAKSGTLGGFLKNTLNNQYYAVSCAHVLGSSGTTVLHPGPTKSLAPRNIGVVDVSELPPRHSGTQRCNSRSSFAANHLDLSVAKVDLTAAQPQPLPGYPSSILMIDQMETNDRVVFEGQESKSVDAKIDDLNLWRTILIEGHPYCFGDLFSIVPRKKPYLNLGLAKPGDSGSWVIYDDPTSPAWAGMVIAADGLKAYCCFAEHIVDRVSNHFGGKGTCVLP
jgi:hypothetical protein